jgi:release factor glutamine methyltransferase
VADDRLQVAGRGSRVATAQTVADLVVAAAALLASEQESRDLVAAYFDQPRHFALLKGNKWVEAGDWKGAMDAAQRRAAGAPLAYAVGKASFRALTLHVDERVLIPRPETELLVDLVLRRQRTGAVLDVGTGSGAIAIALATEGSYDRVVASDISVDALELARANAAACGATIEFRSANLAAGVGSSEFDAIVSNPPYIALGESAELPASVRNWEPATALYSGHDGMTATRRLVREAAGGLRGGGLLALEVDSRRASLVAELLASDGRYEEITVELDLTGRERFVLGTRRRGEGEP